MPKAKATPYLGNHHFRSINNPETGTNEEHIQTLLKELPYFRLAIFLLNKSAPELEAEFRAPDGFLNADKAKAAVEFADTLLKIRERWLSGAGICTSVCARLAAVLDRIERGPQPPRREASATTRRTP